MGRFLEIAFLLKLSRKDSVQFYRLISKLHASSENEGVTFRNDSASEKNDKVFWDVLGNAMACGVVYRCRRKFLLRFLFDYGGIWDAGGRISTILLDQKMQHNYGSMTVLFMSCLTATDL